MAGIQITGEIAADQEEALLDQLRTAIAQHPGIGYAVYTDDDGLTTDLTPAARSLPTPASPDEDEAPTNGGTE